MKFMCKRSVERMDKCKVVEVNTLEELLQFVAENEAITIFFSGNWKEPDFMFEIQPGASPYIPFDPILGEEEEDEERCECCSK